MTTTDCSKVFVVPYVLVLRTDLVKKKKLLSTAEEYSSYAGSITGAVLFGCSPITANYNTMQSYSEKHGYLIQLT